jgi:TPR repeat protein
MIKNRLTVDADAPEIAPDSPFHFPEYARRFKKCPVSRNIELRGGIWNCNNLGQMPNPIQTRDFSVREFWGYGMILYKVEGLILADLTVKDPTNFGVTIDTVSYFTAENIVFDYNLGNPKAIYTLGCLYEFGLGLEVNKDYAYALYEDAYRMKFRDPRAQYKLRVLKMVR